MLRWIFLLRYPEGVGKDAGERWYLGTHTQEAKQMIGLRRYLSWRAEQPPANLADNASARRPAWDRLTELAFADWDAWREGAVEKMPRWTPAPYGPAGFLSETIFIRQQPQVDFLRVTPRLA